MLCVQHWRVCPVVFWRVVWYLRGRDRINVVPVVPVRRARPSCLVMHGRRGRGRAVAMPVCRAVAVAVVAHVSVVYGHVAVVWLRRADKR